MPIFHMFIIVVQYIYSTVHLQYSTSIYKPCATCTVHRIYYTSIIKLCVTHLYSLYQV
jgi:hypothetical protein